jgi:hypothetical protein
MAEEARRFLARTGADEEPKEFQPVGQRRGGRGLSYRLNGLLVTPGGRFVLTPGAMLGLLLTPGAISALVETPAFPGVGVCCGRTMGGAAYESSALNATSRTAVPGRARFEAFMPQDKLARLTSNAIIHEARIRI